MAAAPFRVPFMTDAKNTDSTAGPRLAFDKLAPDVYRALAAVERAAVAGLEPTLVALMKIRASQINGCAFCIDMHTKDARAEGESDERMHLLNAWRESPAFFSERERAALALTEAITLITEGHVPDDVYAQAAGHFDEKELAHLVSVATTINAWNRLAISIRAEPGHYRPAGT
jgi:AhpD family alkylhydroperoxidase